MMMKLMLLNFLQMEKYLPSYDKIIKIFEITKNNDFNIIHTLSGHKKGVTDINFSKL